MDFRAVIKKFKSESFFIDAHRFFLTDQGRNIWDKLAEFLNYKDQLNFWEAVTPKFKNSKPPKKTIETIQKCFSMQNPILITKIFLEVIECWKKKECDECDEIDYSDDDDDESVLIDKENLRAFVGHAFIHFRKYQKIRIFPKN